jgi:hypothetical protein
MRKFSRETKSFCGKKKIDREGIAHTWTHLMPAIRSLMNWLIQFDFSRSIRILLFSWMPMSCIKWIYLNVCLFHCVMWIDRNKPHTPSTRLFGNFDVVGENFITYFFAPMSLCGNSPIKLLSYIFFGLQRLLYIFSPIYQQQFFLHNSFIMIED